MEVFENSFKWCPVKTYKSWLDCSSLDKRINTDLLGKNTGAAKATRDKNKQVVLRNNLLQDQDGHNDGQTGVQERQHHMARKIGN